MLLKVLTLILFLLFSISRVYSQDPYFSQYYNNQLSLNPAFSGEGDVYRTVLHYRNQWPQLGASFKTYAVAFDAPVELLQGGLGFQLLHDNQGGGMFSQTRGSLSYAYQLQAGREFSINAGFEVSVLQYAFNPSNLILPDMIDGGGIPSLPANETISQGTEYIPDFAFGMVAGFRQFYAGAAMHHLTKPEISLFGTEDTRMNRKLTLHAGGNFIVGSRYSANPLILSPNILTQLQSGHNQINYGVYLIKKPFFTGLWLRQNYNFGTSAIIISSGLRFRNYRLTYSYDQNIFNKQLKIPSFGSHEVTLLIEFEYKPKRKKFRAIKCPKI